MREHRAMRDRRYEEQRAADYAAALRREAELAAGRGLHSSTSQLNLNAVSVSEPMCVQFMMSS